MRAYEVEQMLAAVDGYAQAIAERSKLAIAMPADAHLADLRTVTRENKAHLALVNSVIGALPQAEVRDTFRYGAEGRFLVSSPEEAANLDATVLWGPSLVRPYRSDTDREIPGVWPYFVIGRREVQPEYKGDSAKTELLLASAITPDNRTGRPDERIVGIRTTEQVATALAAASLSALEESLSTDDVDKRFDPASEDIAVEPGRFRTRKIDVFTKRAFLKLGQRVLAEGVVPVHDSYVYSLSGFENGISYDDMLGYEIPTHLLRIATIFGQLAVFRDALPATMVPDQPTALQEYVR